MIKTELVCSREYNKRLNPDFSCNDWNRLIKVAKRFERHYLYRMQIVLERIPHYTGLNWPNIYIPIYLVDYEGPSRTNPITIKIDSNRNMLVKLIHELLHVNFPIPKSLNYEIYEDAINQVTEKIAQEIGTRSCGSLEKIIEYRRRMTRKGSLIKRIPLEAINLSQYFGLQKG